MQEVQNFEAPDNEVFCVTYTLRLDRKIFYKFFGTKYTISNDKLKFTDARIPISIPVQRSVEFVGQQIQAPELDKRNTTIFILRMAKPAWYNKTEDDINVEETLDSDSQDFFEECITQSMANQLEARKS